MRRNDTSQCAWILAAMLVIVLPAWSAPVDLAPVTVKRISRSVTLPGDLRPYETVALHAKVRGYVKRVLVDRGSNVKSGDLLVELVAPELDSQTAEAEARLLAAQADHAGAEAQLSAAQSTADRLRRASETPGAIAGNEIIQASKQVEAARSLVDSKAGAVGAARAAMRAQQEMKAYLRVTSPFAGVVTERMVHPGALVGPGADPALLALQQIARLRLVVAVPEEFTGQIATGRSVAFRVPAYPERDFRGAVARIAHSVDESSRTMPVELEVSNRDGALAPGMYATATWPVEQKGPSLSVPKTAVVTTAERTFVICNRNGTAQWVDVRKGAVDGDQMEVFPMKPGALTAKDRVVRRATDEYRDGAPLQR